jgi:hypothetical protein
LNQIASTFGDIYSHITSRPDGRPILDSAFEHKYIVSLVPPYALYAAWNHRNQISQIRCHKLLANYFNAVLTEITRQNLTDKARYFGGCYYFRCKRNAPGLSTHSWGIAIDINPHTNRFGTSGDMSLEIVTIFEECGFFWGGRWPGSRRDPMHFQYCVGY